MSDPDSVLFLERVIEYIDAEPFDQDTNPSTPKRLPDVTQLHELVIQNPYSLIVYIGLAKKYLQLEYPDLAAGAAYKALLLSDALQDESDEYHEQAIDAVKLIMSNSNKNERINDQPVDYCSGLENNDESQDTISVDPIIAQHLLSIYLILAHSLFLCGCFKTAYQYCLQGCNLYPEDVRLTQLKYEIALDPTKPLKLDIEQIESGNDSLSWPDKGFVRREVYSWNRFEPDRLNELPTLNAMMCQVAPKLEVRAVGLPNLTTAGEGSALISQLGVYAKEDIAPGDVILDETSMLTANNKLRDALCDACSADLPDLGSNTDDLTSCEECQTVFCSRSCYERAIESYHPALCDMDVESIAKDVPPAEGADALYSLLLLRALAMAETQNCHPLELKEVKYIWGGFQAPQRTQPDDLGNGRALKTLRKTLPFDFEHNVRLPFHMLEKMGIDIFQNPQYDVWVFNTLYAKFRGTASARLSGLGGRAIRGPEVSAVHPMWCLANHSCDPNVIWEWGGSITFSARKSRVPWTRLEEDLPPLPPRNVAGIKAGEEVINHYCDINLPVHQRREWARGALGGDFRCSRCMWELGP